MKVPCEICKKNFKSEDGREVAYLSFEIELNGQKFNLQPRKDDKKLLNYILEGNPEFR